MRFGKLASIDQTVDIGKNIKVIDMKKLLEGQIISVTKVTVKFSLTKNVNMSIKIQGCERPTKIYTTASSSLSSTTPNTGVVNGQNYHCMTSVNLLPFTGVFSVSLTPNITDSALSKLRSPALTSTLGATLRPTTYTLVINLPSSQVASFTQFGLFFNNINGKLNSNVLISSMTVVLSRVRLSFGKLISTPIKIVVPAGTTVKSLNNVLSQEYTQINSIMATFTLLRAANIRIILNGCYSSTSITLTTQSPVGCLHLNKFYQPSEMVFVGTKCDYRICSDGKVLPIFKCNHEWTSWKPCSKSCGAGQSTRRKMCVFNSQLKSVDKKALMSKVDETCLDKLEIKPCFEKPCEVSCKYSVWSTWTSCDNSTCKDEFQTRTRKEVTNPKHSRCTEPLMESRRCLKPNCSCVENAEMNNCANVICPSDCDHLNDKVKCVTPQTGCVRACACKLGYLYQYGKCVPRSNCECLKPIFKGWTTFTTSSSGVLGGANTTLSSSNAGSSGLSNGSTSSASVDKGMTPRPRNRTIFQIDPISKTEYENMIKNKPTTPPWLPGTTPRSLFYASPPWFPGTTDPGATVKPATEPSTKAPIPTPPSGMTASPPDDYGKNKPQKQFLVTSPYSGVVGPQGPTTTTVVPGVKPSRPTRPARGKSSKSVPSVVTSPKSSAISQPAPPGSGSTSRGAGSPSQTSSVPGGMQATTSPSTDDNHIKSKAPLIVDCQTCICTNGELVCSGPKCHVGNNTWSRWSTWSPCTAICGTGFRRRFRQCLGYGCKDSSIAAPGVKRFSPTIGIEAEDKSCMVTACSCVFTRQWIQVLLGDDQIKKYGIDVTLPWTEKDNKVGLTSPEELVRADDLIKSGDTVFMKCSHCKCSDGQMSCTVDCK